MLVVLCEQIIMNILYKQQNPSDLEADKVLLSCPINNPQDNSGYIMAGLSARHQAILLGCTLDSRFLDYLYWLCRTANGAQTDAKVMSVYAQCFTDR